MTPVLSDEVIITIKGDIELEPSKYVLFYDPQNTLDIHIRRGSGDFSVSVNDSSIIKYTYDRTSHTIRVTPLKIGYAKVIVEDHKLVSAQRVTCEIIVAGVDRIELTTDTHLIEENQPALLTVSVFDQNNNRFKPEDLKSVNFDFALDTISDYQRNNALKITPVANEYNVFRVEGKLTGDHRLSAIATISSELSKAGYNLQKKESNTIDLHVFPKLQSRPSGLVIAPGCLSAIQIVGGPSERSKILNNVELVYSVKNAELVNITQQESSFFGVEGKKVGDGDVTFEIRSKDGSKVIARIVVPINVDFVDGVEILGMLERKIHVGAQARLIAATKIKNQLLRVCSLSIPIPLDFKARKCAPNSLAINFSNSMDNSWSIWSKRSLVS